MARPKIDYPCEWEYRIMGQNEDGLRSAAAEILAGKEYTLSFSNKSKAGKYISLILKTTVDTEGERNEIYVSLRKHPAVKCVI
ncbi:MAG: DUF493 domain-containing protein [Candidatus Omnitrophica bacterium]|nr:DUF493 domain-containing protein [Candidatus Omnitrophota bacterium]